MGLFGRKTEADLRADAWTDALGSRRLPDFVTERFADASVGRVPWTSTMTPAELLAARTHGIRPIATVMGTCWYHYGFSWTNGHAEGWHAAIDRMKLEAVAAGANAVVDVKARTVRLEGSGASMDFSIFGTAVKVLDLPPSPDPVVSTVSTLEFVRLLEAGIVPVGIAIGARYQWLTPNNPYPFGFFGSVRNMPWTEMGNFVESVRDGAIHDLKVDARRQGDGVLANTWFGELRKVEIDKQPIRYLGRHILMGTVVQVTPGQEFPHDVFPVVDMRDAISPLRGGGKGGQDDFHVGGESEGGL